MSAALAYWLGALWLICSVVALGVVLFSAAGRGWTWQRVAVASLLGGLAIIAALIIGAALAAAPAWLFWPAVGSAVAATVWGLRRTYRDQLEPIPSGAPVVRFDGRTPCPMCPPVGGQPVVHGRHHTPCDQP